MLQVCFDCYGSYTTDSVYQWDLNRRLAIRGLDYDSAPAIHFSNKKSTEALVVQSTIEDGVIYCDVPNILLQEPYDIVGYVCESLDQELTTYETIRIPVKPRVKPADYAYENNVEILTYYSLMAEISSVKVSTEKDLNSMDASKASKAELNAVKAEVESNLDTNINRVENEIASERARIDQLVASPEFGEGDLEKEVGDLRIDTKGTTHGSAGTAVRLQIQELDAKIDDEVNTLSGEITEIDEKVLALYKANTEPFDWNKIGTDTFPIGWRGGYYSQLTGEISGSANYIRTLVRLSANNYLTEDIKYLLITPPTGYGVRVFKFNASDSSFLGYVGDYTDIDNPIFMEVSGDYYYTFAIGRFNGDCAEYLTEEFTNTIDLRLIGSNVSTKFKERDSEFIYFNIATTHKESVDCVLTLPTNYQSNGKATPVIVFCHGHSGYIDDGSWSGNSEDLLNLVRSFTSNGFAVFDVDNTKNANGGNTDVGNPKIMESYLKAFEYIKDTYNVENDLYIYSLSFGTFVAMNLLKWYPSKIKTAVLSAPRASLRSVYDRGESYPQKMAEGFGFDDLTGATYEADKVKGYDTTADIVSLNDVEYIFKQFPPIKALMSTGDTNNYDEALREITAIKNAGNVIDLKTVDGLNHHEMCYCMGDGLIEEVNAWFNRFK